ncbi:hypothetical protein A4G26_06070 [Mycobacterium kansasii]|uniref:DUF559 domain-containing protein n=1 Tax=Mycobacterium innocens TaxID=2341083 RepID=A0A498QFS2_9MYCO|nr:MULTISPECIES: hypothetical protein [Mycobacterium]KZS72472.1 hypothetical protein A4G26_06070 [Mycobacterium kansasii]VBA42440.1 hypothetical protein LAUMK13_04024 [Mycobacterium innocens]
MASEEPFIGSEAVHSGTLRPHQLRSRFRLAYPDVYVRRDQQLTLRHRAVAAWLWSHRRGVLARAHRRREELKRLSWLVVRVAATDSPADIIRRIRAALEFRASSLR